MQIVRIKVKPGAREVRIEHLADDSLLIRLKAQPVSGKANAELIAVLARYFGVRKNQVAILQGAHSVNKRIAIQSD